jgi:hypothetical protein
MESISNSRLNSREVRSAYLDCIQYKQEQGYSESQFHPRKRKIEKTYTSAKSNSSVEEVRTLK